MTVKILVDFMLGKLARALRIMGFDTSYIRAADLPNKNPLILLKLAKEDNRIILTRNTKLKQYPEVFFITSEKINEQLDQVIKHYKLKKEIKLFSRCLICNEVLVGVAKEIVKGRVPFYTFETHDQFVECPKCKKIYWQGTHLQNMTKRVKKVLKQS